MCLASGIIWGLLLLFLTNSGIGRSINLGVLLATPLIALAIGYTCKPLLTKSRWLLLPLSLINVFAAVPMLVIAGGIWRIAFHHWVSQPTMSFIGAVIYCTAVTWSGLVVSGAALCLWPLSLANLLLLSSIARSEDHAATNTDSS